MGAFIRSHSVLIVVTGLYVANFMDRSVIAVVLEPMKLDLGLTDAQAGLVQSILLLCLPLILIPSSLALDIWGRKRILILVTLAWSLGTLGTGLATGFVLLLAARAVCSWGEAGFGSGGTSWIAMSYPPEKRSRMLGIFGLSAPLGMALGTFGGGLLVAMTGSWRTPFLLLIVPGIILVVGLLFLKDYDSGVSEDKRRIGFYLADTAKLFRNRTLIIVGFATAAYCFVKFSYQGWVPTMLVRNYGLDCMQAGHLFTLMVLAGMLGPIFGGIAADWRQKSSPIGRPQMAVLFLCAITLSKAVFYGLMGHVPLAAIVAVGIADSIITMAPIPVYFTVVQDVVPVRLKSTAVGLFGTIVFLGGGAWGPIAVGALSDRLGGGTAINMAMQVNVGMAILGAFFFFVVCRTYVADRQRIEAEEGSAFSATAVPPEKSPGVLEKMA